MLKTPESNISIKWKDLIYDGDSDQKGFQFYVEYRCYKYMMHTGQSDGPWDYNQFDSFYSTYLHSLYGSEKNTKIIK